MSKLFKNAILISDRFHIVFQVRNALDNTRKRLCNKKANPNYKKVKKYLKLILKKENDSKRNSNIFN